MFMFMFMWYTEAFTLERFKDSADANYENNHDTATRATHQTHQRTTRPCQFARVQTPRVAWPLRHRGRLACTRSLERRTAVPVYLRVFYTHSYVI